ncbi:MAG: alpha/beta fold hydrolase [Flavobacteriaceae bacterium]|nr:alpha/beta fold hydrolase [Flavobacteriaceae bacterium]
MQILHSIIHGQGQPFIILHGFLGMSDNWKSLGTRFSDEGFEMHLIDQRNHGKSFHSDEFSYEILVEDLKSYCDEHDLNDIILLGHSMGGKTAMLFAATYPGYMSKLIIADIAPRFYPRHHQDILNGLSALDFSITKSRMQAEEVLSNYVTHVPTRKFLLKNVYWKEKGQLALRINLEALIENIDEIGEGLPNFLKFEGDALFLKGDRSEYINDDDERSIKAQFENAIIFTIKEAGHWLHVENPDGFFEAVMNFVYF